MYPKALECGVSIECFWDSSVMEIIDLIEAKHRAEDKKTKQDIRFLFLLAEIIGENINKYWSKDVAVRKTWDVFPDLFADDKLRFEEQKLKEDFEKAKENRRRLSLKFKRGGGEQ